MSLKEFNFGISDPGMVFEILRDKLYSNKHLAVCREIMCNARDAHREVNKDNVPIEISLPSENDLFLKIKDNGPGISPDRIANVFVNFASSTKKNDLNQTGAFGIGAKVPFAYTDEFYINTITDNILRKYVCSMKEVRGGKLSLISEDNVEQANGTEVIIPVKKDDISIFKRYVDHVSNYWEIKPIINNAQSNVISPIFAGTNWKVIDKNCYNRLHFIVDEIEYNIDLSALNYNFGFITRIPVEIIFHFSNKSLSISANRESIYLDEKTIKCVKETFENFKQEYVKYFVDNINNQTSLPEANKYFIDNNSLFEPTGHVFIYNNVKLIHALTLTGYFTFDVVKQESNRYKVSENYNRYIYFDEFYKNQNIKIYQYDTEEDKKFLDKEHCRLFAKKSGLNRVFYLFDKKENIDLYKGYLTCEIKPLDEFFKTEIVKRSNSSRMITYKAIGESVRRTKYKDFEDDKSPKFLLRYFMNSYNEKVVVLPNNKRINKYQVGSFINQLACIFGDSSIYFIDFNEDELNQNYENISELEEENNCLNFIDEINKKITYEAQMAKSVSAHSMYVENKVIRELNNEITKNIIEYAAFLGPRNEFISLAKCSEKAKNEYEKFINYRNLNLEMLTDSVFGYDYFMNYNDFIKNMNLRGDTNNSAIINLIGAIEDKYLLINKLGYCPIDNEDVINHFVEYIKAIDARAKSKCS